ETVLMEDTSVQEAAVILREDVPDDKRLVAYVVPAAGCEPSVSRYRALVARKLPAYMLPSGVFLLDAIPATPSGKVDGRGLAAPDQQRPMRECGFAAGRTEVERTLAKIWERLLSVERVGVHDRFFDLGGHSLLATQVVSRIRDAFGVGLQLRT